MPLGVRDSPRDATPQGRQLLPHRFLLLPRGSAATSDWLQTCVLSTLSCPDWNSRTRQQEASRQTSDMGCQLTVCSCIL